MQGINIRKIYLSKKNEIENRLKEFRRAYKTKNDKEIFAELAFCLLTPQSKAKICWNAILDLIKKNKLYYGSQHDLLCGIKNIRFKNKKAVYIYRARSFFSHRGRFIIKPLLRKFHGPRQSREWLVRNIKGMGYKEASHFLRNIGLGYRLAILDRHVLKNLKRLKVIRSIPQSLTRKKYLDIEKNMVKFARRVKVPMDALDLVFWCKETGDIFK